MISLGCRSRSTYKLKQPLNDFKQDSAYNVLHFSLIDFVFFSDIPECSKDPSPCSQHCVEQPGSYYCLCNETGYQLDVDQATCVGKSNQYFAFEFNKKFKKWAKIINSTLPW